MVRRSNVLLVDDTPAKLAALEAVLAPLNQNLVKARSGVDALRRLLEQDFAVILLDIRMGDLDGFETAELIRLRRRSEHTPIIFLTAFDKAEVDMSRGYSLGAVDFVFSPIVPEVLRAKVKVFVDLHQQAEAIRELYSAAQAASRAKSEFLNMAAHELRTPLSVIFGYLSMLAEGSLGATPPVWKAPLEMLITKTNELNKIVDDLLLASRMDAEKAVDQIVSFDVREAASRAVERAGARANLLGARLRSLLPAEPAWVAADPDHLGRVLDNLLNNALTYCVATPDVTVEVRNGEPVVLRVHDNGIGIPANHAEDVFERFVRLDDAELGPVPGTGLGLYIARQLTRRHGGELRLERSEKGIGSTFMMTIPAAVPPARTRAGRQGGNGRHPIRAAKNPQSSERRAQGG
jgi:signal transduction histidine kinase